MSCMCQLPDVRVVLCMHRAAHRSPVTVPSYGSAEAHWTVSLLLVV